MSVNEIKDVFQEFYSLGFGGIFGAVFMYLIMRFFLPSYFSSKAKNLATKEDVGAITREVEQVKSGYAQMLEEVRNNHQMKLASIEREQLLRKDVYLEGFEALNKYQGSLALMSNLTIPNQVLADSFSSSAAQASKITLVGSEETVKNFTFFMGEVAASYMSLLLERGELVSRKEHIEFLETYRQKHSDEIDRYLMIMKNLNLDGITDQSVWERVNRSFEDECNSRDRISAEINANWAIQNQEHLKFSQRCVAEFFRVNDIA
ncbi:chromosome partitioning protein ParA, partial [Vibrio fluvialis]|nr:chromosome partitioning protein ParA [Vibrio fluvialis]